MFEKMSEHMFKFGQETYDSYEDLFSKSLSSDIVMLPFFWEVFLERFVKDLKESDNIESVVTWITYSLSDSIHTHPVNDKFFASFISKWVSVFKFLLLSILITCYFELLYFRFQSGQ